LAEERRDFDDKGGRPCLQGQAWLTCAKAVLPVEHTSQDPQDTTDVGEAEQELQFHHPLPFQNVYSVLIAGQSLYVCMSIAIV